MLAIAYMFENFQKLSWELLHKKNCCKMRLLWDFFALVKLKHLKMDI